MKIIPIFLVLLIFSMGVVPAYSETIQLITKNGNVINVEVPTTSSDSSPSTAATGTATANATSVLNGFGYTANIVTIQEEGRITLGNGIIGIDKSITPYSPVASDTNFAALIKDTDTKLSYTIPEFWRQYEHNNFIITDVTVTQPNVLGYSASKTNTGSVTTSISNDGLTISGNGEAVYKLNNYQGQSLIIRGDAGTGVIKIITSPIDLTSATYTSGLGYLIHTGATSGLSKVIGNESTSTGKYDYSYWVSAYSHRHNCKCSNHWHSGYTAYAYDATAALVKVDNISHKIITGMSNGGGNLRIWDTLPSVEGVKLTGTFETNYLFPNEQSYLYVKPNGNTMTIKAETSVSIPIVDMSGLPANIPYQISKEGWIGATGLTSSTGTITLTDSDVRFQGFIAKGGLLSIFPDSLTYAGAFTTIALDKMNNKSFHITDGADQVYVPAAFVKLPIPLDVEINKIKVGTVTFDYLTGNYTAGDSVFVPIIPKMKTLDLTLNDVNAVINIADIANQAQAKLLSSRTDSTTLYATGSAIESIEVGVTNTAVAIATHTGTMNAVIAATVSGEAEFTINSDYTGSYEQTYDFCQAAMAAYGASNGCVQHGHPTDGKIMAALIAGQAALDSQLASHKAALEAAIIAQGPLTVTVTVFKNGEYENTFEVFDNLNPQFTASSSLGLVSVQNAHVVYSTTSGSKPVTIDVEAGDYVEFVVHAGLIVSGIPSPIALDNSSIAGFASGTVNLHHGTITASMG